MPSLPDAELREWLAFAHGLADAASAELLAWFGKATAQLKYDGSFVTEADLAVDRLIQQALAARYPDHGLISEETSLTYLGHDFTWVVDPLDGTNNFTNGLPLWGCSIALLYQGEPVLGVLDFPPIGQRYSAVQGQGAQRNGLTCRVPPLREPQSNQFFVLDARSFRLLHTSFKPKARVLGVASYDLVAVSNGVVVGCCELLPKIWDLAAAWLILREAGAVVEPLFGGAQVFPLQPGRDYSDRVFPLLAAADGARWRELRAALRIKPDSDRLRQTLQAQGWQVE